MAQSIVDLQSNNIIPYPNGNSNTISSFQGTALNADHTILTYTGGGSSNMIQALLVGASTNDLGGVQYNDITTFGGQTTPTTAWLSTAQDDSWEPRYQAVGAYQQTTQVPTQQAPLMTHVYCLSEAVGAVGIWRIERVIDDNNFVVYDPSGSARTTFGAEALGYLCQNVFPSTSVQIVSPTSVDVTMFFVDGTTTTSIGPTNMTMTANQFGIVEPFLAFANGAGGIAIVNR